MFPKLFLLFTLLPAAELFLLIRVGSVIGPLPTVLIIIFTGIFGAALARYEGLRVWTEANRNMQRGILPTNQMLDGLLVLVAGILLVTPGFITDISGILLLLPPVRALVRNYLKLRFAEKIKISASGAGFPGGREYRRSGTDFDPDRHQSPGSHKPDIVIPPANKDE